MNAAARHQARFCRAQTSDATEPHASETATEQAQDSSVRLQDALTLGARRRRLRAKRTVGKSTQLGAMPNGLVRQAAPDRTSG